MVDHAGDTGRQPDADAENVEPTASSQGQAAAQQQFADNEQLAESATDSEFAQAVEADPTINVAIRPNSIPDPEPEPADAADAAPPPPPTAAADPNGAGPAQAAPRRNGPEHDGLPPWFAEEDAKHHRKLDDGDGEEFFWQPASGDDSLKAQLFNATARGTKKFGLLATDDEEPHLAYVNTNGQNGEHVTLGFKDNSSISFGPKHMQANNLMDPGQKERAARMMVDQAHREGWKTIHITGRDKDFKDLLFLEAKRYGLKPKGHNPTTWAIQMQANTIVSNPGPPRGGSPFRLGTLHGLAETQGALTGDNRGDRPDAEAPAATGGEPTGPDHGGGNGGAAATPPAPADGPGPQGPDDRGAGPAAGPNGGGDPTPPTPLAPQGSGGGAAIPLPDQSRPEPAADVAAAKPVAAIEAPVTPKPAAGNDAAVTRVEPPKAERFSAVADQLGVTKDQMDKIIRPSLVDLADMKLNGKPPADPAERKAYDHIFGKPNAETAAAFKDQLRSVGIDTHKADVNAIAAYMREGSRQVMDMATGKLDDAAARKVPAGMADAKATTANLLTAAPGAAAQSSPHGLDVKGALTTLRENPQVRQATTRAVQALVTRAPAVIAAAAAAHKAGGGKLKAAGVGLQALLTQDGGAGKDTPATTALVDPNAWRQQQALARFDSATGQRAIGSSIVPPERRLPGPGSKTS